MNFKKTLKLAAIFLGIINAKEIPIADGKVNFSEDQKASIKDSMTEETMQEAINLMNKEIAENDQVKGIEAKIQETLNEIKNAESESANTNKQKVLGEDDADTNLTAEEALKRISTLTKEKDTLAREKDALIAKMMKQPEQNLPVDRVKGKVREMIQHSATHVFGSNKEYDKLEGRNWNQRLTGKSTTATDFTDPVNIQKLNGDATLYVRENPTSLTSLQRDSVDLPKDWKRRFNVVDRIASGTISTAELTQARKYGWQPKNSQDIQAEEGKIFPIQIDIEFVGYLLQEIEASWLAMYNNEGSQYDKMTFVRFLLQELDKRARVEDRIATIKGVYVATPKGKTGNFINRQDGLLVLLWRARDISKKYRPFSLGVPTDANILDYVDNAIKSLPENVRKMQGLALNLSDDMVKSYKRRYEFVYGQNQDYKGYPPYPKDYPNIKFQPLIDLDGSKFMFITFPKNIEILENIPKEKSKYRFGFDGKRNITILADYKMGIRPIHIGTEVKEGDPDAFKVQTIWSNDMPIFPDDFFAPVYDDTTGKIKATFNQYQVDEDWKTEITDVTGLTPGIIFRLQGNTSLAATTNVVSSGNLDLASNFDLKSGGTLTLLVLEDGTLKELKRTTEPVAAPLTSDATYTGATIDAQEGSEFTYTGSGAVTITEILNGVQSQSIKIFGKAGAGTDVTINTVGNIKTDSAAVLATDTDFIELVLVDGVWTEYKRDITA